MKTAFERQFGQIVEKVRALMGETGNNRALRLSDMQDAGVIGQVIASLRKLIGAGGGGTGPATTDDLPEGSVNLYHTTARAAAAAPVQRVAGLVGTIAADDLAQALDLGVGAGANSTDDLPEGATNLYFTGSRADARADARIAAQKGAALGLATLGADAKIPSAQLPALAITEPYVVTSQAAQLALPAQEGDVAIRTDISKNFIHNGGTAGTMADWFELLTPGAPVQSVNGQTGNITLFTDDLPESGTPTNKWFTDARARAAVDLSFPYYNADGVYDPLALTVAGALPYYLADGSRADIPMVT